MTCENMMPVVRCGVCFPVARDWENSPLSDREFAEQHLAEISEENPNLANLLRKLANCRDFTSDGVSVLLTGALIYKLLKNQAEIDCMESEIPLH